MLPGLLRRLLPLLTVVLALVAAGTGAAATSDVPTDAGYADEVAPGGWLARIGWRWDDVARAVDAGRAFPTVAVVDSGVDTTHAEFAGALDPSSADCSRGTPARADESLANLQDRDPGGHGTVVAGLAAAPANGIGIVGVSPFSPLLVVRLAQPFANVACALSWLAADARRSGTLLVVNLSLEERAATPREQALVRSLVRAGALLVAATGNRGGGPIAAPARLPHVLAVGDAERRALRTGSALDLLAPASGLVVPHVGGGYETERVPYTSWATPVVAGAAAAVWGIRTDGDALSAQQVAYLLRRGASNHGRWRAGSGFGVVSVAGALRVVAPPDDESEPDETPALARAGGTTCRRVCHGIAGTTDDPVDVWPVPAGARGAWACAGPGVAVTALHAGPRSFVRVEARRPLVAYTLRLRAARCPSGRRIS